MFKIEKVLTSLLVVVCLFVTLGLVMTVVGPDFLPAITLAAEGEEGLEWSFTPETVSILPELEEGWELFKNQGYAFQIQFPQQVAKKSILNQQALNSGLGVSPETPVWKFEVRDQALREGTNLLEASVVVHVLRGREALDQCSEPKPGSILGSAAEPWEELPVVEISGVLFWKDVVEEGVMGEWYNLISYRTRSQGACYEITQLIHTRNIGLYESGTIKEYDREAVLDQLDEVLGTFQFLDVQPSFPEVSYPVPKTLSTAVSKAAGDHVYGLDVSHWQGDIQWNKVVDAGYVFSFVKGTEGVGWKDVKFVENMENGKAAGELLGVYHFARPDLGNSGKEEAEYFLSQSGDYLESGYIRPVLDLEVRGNLNKTQLTAWVLEWMETVKNRTGVSPLIYTNLNFINNYLTSAVTEYDLWIAYWSCEPDPTFDIPPTGKWADWSFWQYYGPGGCGSNAGYVPGIETNIDLNIFNGVESGLGEYDAASPLWVSVTSDAYLAPAPYYADITADVNGDAAGPVNFHFWWDCAALGADIAGVEGSCGELPTPNTGTCLKNENGMRCLAVDSELQMYEHTYQDIGDYTAKVIVERGNAQPAEDRYKITTYNPLRYTVLDPPATADAVSGELFSTKAKVRLRTSVTGPVQVSVEKADTGEIVAQKCDFVGHDAKVDMVFSLAWVENGLGIKTYHVSTRYRPGGSCPITDTDPDDLSQSYTVDWLEPAPVLELERPAGVPILAERADEVGDQEINKTVELSYQVENHSTAESFQIQSLALENLVNVSGVSLNPAGPVEVAPGEIITLGAAFQVDDPGPFSFDLVVEHEASNPSPYRITVQGRGIEIAEPIQTLSASPKSPGESWIGETYLLQVQVGVDLPASGVLQTSVVNTSGDTVEDQVCRTAAAGQSSEVFDLSWVESSPGEANYVIWSRYRAEGSCPIEDLQDQDVSQPYVINWQEDPPVLSLEQSDGSALPAGDVVEVGEVGFYETVELDYLVHNSSTTSSLQITGIAGANLDHLSSVQITPTGSFELGAGAKKAIAVSFLVDDTGPFSFDLQVAHDGSNPSPYSFTIQGSGVLLSDPIQSLSLEPVSPDSLWIGETFPLSMEAAVDIPAAGALEVRVVHTGTGKTKDSSCQAVDRGLNSALAFDLYWTESEPGETNYTVEARYQAGSGCPLEGAPDDQVSQAYAVTWTEDTPVLDIQRPADNQLPAGSRDELGEYEFYQVLELDYLVHNPSTTSSMRIDQTAARNLENLSAVNVSPSGPVTLGPGEKKIINVSFRVENTGPFSFDLTVDHNGGNPSPYVLTVQGSGVLTDNLIQYISPDPLTPGSALIHSSFSLVVRVGLDIPDQGALQVVLRDQQTEQVVDEACQLIKEPLPADANVDLSWLETTSGKRDYSIRVRYRARGGCPFGEDYDAERTQNYQVVWQEVAPVLELQRTDGSALADGSVDSLDQLEYAREMETVYVLHNQSPTTSMKVNSAAVIDPVNISGAVVDPVGPFTLGPGGKQTLTISYQVEDLGPYSFQLAVEHDASNASPYQLTARGSTVLTENPIRTITLDSASPAQQWIGEVHSLSAEVVLETPAAGALQVSVIERGSGAIKQEGCLAAAADPGELVNVFEFEWTETTPGEKEYDILARYRMQGECPLGSTQDAELAVGYQVSWQAESPVLEVKRPEGVSIFAGGVDYVGTHDFFGFVEVTYVVENQSRTTPVQVENLFAENLVNLLRVRVSPSGPFEIGAGEQETVQALFLVLSLDSYSFDLVLEHDGDTPQPYVITVLGDGRLNLGEYQADSWVYNKILAMIDDGFFLRLPDYILDIVEGYLE